MLHEIHKCGVGCGRSILLSRPESFTVVNKRKVCYACSNNDTILSLIRGHSSYRSTPIKAARFDTLCKLQKFYSKQFKTIHELWIALLKTPQFQNYTFKVVQR